MRSIYFTNRKEYYRRKKISSSLRRYWAERQRKRTQVCYNSEYNISIRAIQIDGKATKDYLITKIEEFLNSNPILQNIPFDTEGFENERIDASEDKNLVAGKIYIELNLRGKVTMEQIQ